MNGRLQDAFSNSYVGNAWRTAAVNIFDAYTADLVEQGVLSKAYSSSAGDDVQAQINEIRNMMSEGYDAIVCIAASATGLQSVLEEAAERASWWSASIPRWTPTWSTTSTPTSSSTAVFWPSPWRTAWAAKATFCGSRALRATR